MKHVNAETLIIGGQIAEKDHYPWTIGIYNATFDHICGGSLINQKVVISGETH